MASLAVTLPATTKVCNGKQVTFRAPCNCESIDSIRIEGTNYNLVDSAGHKVSNGFKAGSLVSVILDTSNLTACLLTSIIKNEHVQHTLLASSWNSNRYSFEGLYPSEYYDIEISVDSKASREEVEIYGSALICGSHNSNIVTAKGDVPRIDIPIIIKVVSK